MAPAEQLDITWCEGWDPTSRTVVGVLVAVARARDRDQYAVLLGGPQRPYALIEVAWRHFYAGVWFFDETLWEPWPRFGAWASLVRRERDRPASMTLVQRPDHSGGARGPTPGLPPERHPWRPPRPLAPSNVDTLFQAGTRFALPVGERVSTARIDVRELGRLRMPTGRLAAVFEVRCLVAHGSHINSAARTTQAR
jgi:hypothetical protein